MSRNYPAVAKLDGFLDSGWIADVLYPVKSGKEAAVYCCSAGPLAATRLLAAKIYHSQDFRGFHNDTVYQDGRVILNGHTRRAVAKGTRFGREAQAGMWTAQEFETLRTLANIGAAVPRPFTSSPNVILMEFVGDADGPAPLLNEVQLERHEAEMLFEGLLRNIELWLAYNRVHADLSPFNILYHAGTITVIDFPQAVDPRFNPHARGLLERDLGNVGRYFARFGIRADPQRLADDLWWRFQRAEL